MTTCSEYYLLVNAMVSSQNGPSEIPSGFSLRLFKRPNDHHSVKFRCDFCFVSHTIEINVCQDIPDDTSVRNQFDYCNPCPTPECNGIWKVKFVQDSGAFVRPSPLLHLFRFVELCLCSYFRCVGCCPLEYFVTPSSTLVIINACGNAPVIKNLEIVEDLVWKDESFLPRDIKFDSFDCFFGFKSSTDLRSAETSQSPDFRNFSDIISKYDPSDIISNNDLRRDQILDDIISNYNLQKDQIVAESERFDAKFKDDIMRFYGTVDGGEEAGAAFLLQLLQLVENAADEVQEGVLADVVSEEVVSEEVEMVSEEVVSEEVQMVSEPQIRRVFKAKNSKYLFWTRNKCFFRLLFSNQNKRRVSKSAFN